MLSNPSGSAVLNPATGWQRVADLPREDLARCALPHGSKVFYCLLPGQGGGRQPMLVSYDPKQDTWQTLAPPPKASYGFGFVALGNDMLLLFGGTADGRRETAHGMTFSYHVSQQSWTARGNMSQPRVAFTFTALATRPDVAVCVGGMDKDGGTGTFINTADVYNDGEWSAVSLNFTNRAFLLSSAMSLPAPAETGAAAGAEGESDIYLFGGAHSMSVDSNFIPAVLQSSFSARNATALPDCPKAWRQPALGVITL